MSKSFVVAGMLLSIGPAKAFNGTDLTVADFTTGTPTWALVDGVTNMGSVGDTAELVTSNVISQSRTRKAKGVRNAGTMTITCDLDYADPGQLAVIAAEKTKDTYAFRIEFNDKPALGASPKNSMRYFVALVMSAVEQFDEANNMMKLAITLEVDSNIVRVAASAT